MTNYKCNYCGKWFEFSRDKSTHQEYCGMTQLDDYDDTGEIIKLDNINKALRINDYDYNDTTTDKTTQRTLRNRVVRKQQHNNKR